MNYTKKFRDPESFDIVIFKYPDDESKLYIKSSDRSTRGEGTDSGWKGIY